MKKTLSLIAALSCATGSIAETEKADSRIKPLTEGQLSRDQITVAAVQLDSPWNFWAPIDPENDPADKMLPYIEQAAEDNADLVVFPELYLGMFRVPSPQTETVSQAAAAHNINVMVGCFEIIDEEGNYGNSTLIFDREGEIIGRYFKAAPAVGEGPRGWPPKANDPEWMMTAGNEFPTFDLDFGRVGIMTCYDGYFPEIPRILALKGAEIIIWPNARGGSIEKHLVQATMQYNYVHMITTNKAVGAGTMIAAWPNRIEEHVDEAEDAYIVSDLHLDHLRESRVKAREFHQRVPETYKEILQDWPVWEFYGREVEDVIPEPDLETRNKLVEMVSEEVSKSE